MIRASPIKPAVRLAERPDMGDVIEGTRGIRKVQVAFSGHGKRGGSGVSCDRVDFQKSDSFEGFRANIGPILRGRP